MSQFSQRLDVITEAIRQRFDRRDAAREKALPLSREAIRYASLTIRAIHRHERHEASENLERCRSIVAEAEAAIGSCDSLASVNFFLDAQKEYAEAATLLAMVGPESLPSPIDLGVDEAAYLNGLAEAASELRRFLLDGLREGDFNRSEEILDMMDAVYEVLVTIDYPDAITGGLRRTTDMVRGVLEKTRSDLTLIMQQQSLEAKLASFNQRLDK